MKTVLITGAAKGIGFYLTSYFLASGYKVFMVDKDPALHTSAKQLENSFKKENIIKFQTDITSKHGIPIIKSTIRDEKLNIDILINNAGIGQHSTLIDTPSDRMTDLMNVNFFAADNLIRAVIPTMIENGSGQIVNVCSGQVFFNLPTWAAYTCTKAALSAYSEALYHELKPKGITVTTVYPFMVNTGFYNDVKGQTLGGKLSMILLPLYSMKPEKVAKIIYQAVLKKKRREMVSMLNYAGQLINTFPPLSNIVGKISNYILTK